MAWATFGFLMTSALLPFAAAKDAAPEWQILDPVGDAKLASAQGPATSSTLASDSWDIRRVYVRADTPTELVVAIKTGSLGQRDDIIVPAGVYHAEMAFRLEGHPVHYRVRYHSNYDFNALPEPSVFLDYGEGVLCISESPTSECFLQRVPSEIDHALDEIVLRIPKQALSGQDASDGFWTSENPILEGFWPEPLSSPPVGTPTSVVAGMRLTDVFVRTYPRGDFPVNWYDDTGNAPLPGPYALRSSSANRVVGFTKDWDGSGVEVGSQRLFIANAFNLADEPRTLRLDVTVTDADDLWWAEPGSAHFQAEGPQILRIGPKSHASIPVLVRADADALRQYAYLHVEGAAEGHPEEMAYGRNLLVGVVSPSSERPHLYLHSRNQGSPVQLAFCTVKLSCNPGWYNSLVRDPWPGEESYVQASDLPVWPSDPPVFEQTALFWSSFGFSSPWAVRGGENMTFGLRLSSPVEVSSTTVSVAWLRGPLYAPEPVANGSARVHLKPAPTYVEVPARFVAGTTTFSSDDVPEWLFVSFEWPPNDPSAWAAALHPEDFRVWTKGSNIRLPLAPLPVRAQVAADTGALLDARPVGSWDADSSGLLIPPGKARLVNLTIYSLKDEVILELRPSAPEGWTLEARPPGPLRIAPGRSVTVGLVVSRDMSDINEQGTAKLLVTDGRRGLLVGTIEIDLLRSTKGKFHDPRLLFPLDEGAREAMIQPVTGNPTPSASVMGFLFAGLLAAWVWRPRV